MHTEYLTYIVNHPERMVYRFSIIGYLFGRELWRETFYCGSKARGVIYAEWYLKNRVAGIACDQYRVEMFDGEDTHTVIGESAPEKVDHWKDDVVHIMVNYSDWDTTFRPAANQAGWKERHGVSRIRSAAMRVGVGAGRH